MIEIVADSGKSHETKSMLQYIGSRIKTVSLMYDLLYSDGMTRNVRLDEYLLRIADSLTGSLENIQFYNSCEPIICPVKEAITIGIITTELLTNSIKYAFPGKRKGTISLKLEQTGREAELSVDDDGIGLPENFNIAQSDTLGYKLVHALIHQIDGEITIERKYGTHCNLKFTHLERSTKGTA